MTRQIKRERTNTEWVEQLRGDRGIHVQGEAYEDLTDLLYRRIYIFLLKRQSNVPNLEDKNGEQMVDLAEDFTQSVVLKIFQNKLYDQYRGEAQFTTYMTSIALNEVRQELRKKRWWVPDRELSSFEESTETGLPSLEFRDPSALDSLHRQELQEVWEVIRNCVDQLPLRWRQAFVWSLFDDLSTGEIKQRLNGVSDQVVYNLIHRARRRLHECVKARGLVLADVWHLFDR